MVDRRIAAAGLFVIGLAAGWYLRVYLHTDSSLASVNRAATFDTIYRNATWGKNGGSAGTSGNGSRMETTVAYRAFLEQFMRELRVHSVVDAGCGDWEFSQSIDWSGIDYKGYDIVPSVIERDRARFGKPNIQFFTADIVEADLPPADLLIVKDVLQHLPNADVQRFLTTQLPKYRFALLVDGVDDTTLTAPNRDIQPGEYRVLDPTQPPFGLRGLKVLTWWDGANTHQVLWVRR